MLKNIKSILYINDKAGNFGGTEEYLNSLSKTLKSQGISSSIIYGERKGDLPKDIDQYFHLPEMRERNSTADLAPQISAIVSSLQPGMVYLHNIFNMSVFRALHKPKRPFPVLFYLHDHYFTCLTELRMNKLQPNGLCTNLLSEECISQTAKGNCVKRFEAVSFELDEVTRRWELIKGLSSVDAVVVVSPYMKELIIKHFPEIEKKVFFIPRQVRCGNMRRNSLEESGILRIGFVGRIAFEKGLHVALSALALLNIEEPIEFVIAGVIENQDYWRRCERIINKMNAENSKIKITYKGQLSYREVDLLYSTIDIKILPSLWGEPSGTVVAEAMCHECAVIASNVGGVWVWVNDETGMLIEPDDPGAIVCAIERMARDRDLMRSLGRNGKRFIQKHFNEKQHLKHLNRILTGIFR